MRGKFLKSGACPVVTGQAPLPVLSIPCRGVSCCRLRKRTKRKEKPVNLEKLIELIAEQAAREVVATTPSRLSAALVILLDWLCYEINKLSDHG